jgi:transcriptional regulator GlxA family with amidase domain
MIAQEEMLIDWLRRVVRPGVRLVTICSGALLAGRAGLLDGHACTTHHESVAELRQAAPLAKVLENRLFVEDRERLTSAGITAGIDMMLAEVTRVAGPAVSVAVARHLVVYQRRAGSDPQVSPFLCGRNHLHPVIHAVQDAISADPVRPWSLGVLARLAATSARNLSRLFNEQTGLTIPDYINRLRVARAGELLAGSRLTIEEVAERAGFGSARQLRRAWNRVHETPPSRARHRNSQP